LSGTAAASPERVREYNRSITRKVDAAEGPGDTGDFNVIWRKSPGAISIADVTMIRPCGQIVVRIFDSGEEEDQRMKLNGRPESGASVTA
jgi:hypothetical protein